MKTLAFTLIFLAVLSINGFSQSIQVIKSITTTSPKSTPGSDEEHAGEETEESSNILQTFPNIISASSPFRLIPNIDVLASNIKYDANSGRTHSIRVFTSGTSFDTSIVQNGFNYLVPESSKMGLEYTYSSFFSFSNNIDNEDTPSFLFNFKAGFLGKEVPKRQFDSILIDAKNFLAIHSKVGIEWLFVKDMLSIYSNLNVLGTTTGVSSFKEYFNIEENRPYWFFDIGMKAELILGEDKSNAISLDVGFINNAGDIHIFNRTEDVLLPKISFGFKKILKPNTNTDKDTMPPPAAPKPKQ